MEDWEGGGEVIIVNVHSMYQCQLTTSVFSEKIPSCRLSSAIHLMGSRTAVSSRPCRK